MTRVHVGGDAPYDVVIGTGVLGQLPALVGEARTVAVVHPEGLPEIARPVCGALAEAGYDVHAFPVPDGEAGKEVAVLAGLWSGFARLGMTRTDVVVGV
ncbi:MAG: 3-dehydroquinate synthase, partial [Actinoallomurus sp.]